jgi:hypothetical protein
MTDEKLNLLRHDLLHMNLEELVAFGRAAERGSVEHIEAQAEFKRRRDREPAKVEPPPPAYTSEELAEMAG